MLTAVWLILSNMLYSLQLQSGSFPKPLTAKEERYYLEKAAQGDLEARNILIERNLRLVAHISVATSFPSTQNDTEQVRLPVPAYISSCGPEIYMLVIYG